MTTTHVPTLNLSFYNDPDTRAALIKGVGDAYRQWGFCAFVGHGIDPEVIGNARRSFRNFFGLPIDAKMRCHWPAVGGRRGYTPFGVEKAKNAHVHDLKEFYHIGRTGHDSLDMPANIWPMEVPRMQMDTLAMFEAFEETGRTVLKAMSLALGAGEDDLWSMTEGGNSVLRGLHYPPIPAHHEAGAIRAAAHEDISFITLLIGGSAGGLEVRSRNHGWVPVVTDESAIVVNVGDMLQKVSNRVFPSTTHRVVNPDGDQARVARFSMPFFMDPHPDTLLKALPCTISADRPEFDARPIRAHDYLMQRMREINLDKKTP